MAKKNEMENPCADELASALKAGLDETIREKLPNGKFATYELKSVVPAGSEKKRKKFEALANDLFAPHVCKLITRKGVSGLYLTR